jgi:hypothetical protein
VHLISILTDGELKPADDDLLWASTSEHGDALASLGTGNANNGRDLYRKGDVSAVRFTCDANAFRPDWQQAQRFTNKSLWWNVERLERLAARYHEDTGNWLYRTLPLSIGDCLIEARRFDRPWWTEVKDFEVLNLVDKMKAVRFGSTVHLIWEIEDDKVMFRRCSSDLLPILRERSQLFRDLIK